ncbi:hypothetical protein K490DRAFT_40640, partial [Saccharata proteae CBS 121410]
RDDGLSHFRYILTLNRNNPKVLSLDEKAFKEMFSILYEFMSVQVDIYSNLVVRKGRKGLKKTDVANNGPRLTSCAAALRIAVEAGVRHIRIKTVRSLIGHTLQMLRAGSDGRCEPLEADYVKCIRIILEHQPHTEHLTSKEWTDIAEFCIERITRLNSASQQPSGSVQNTLRSSSVPPEPSAQPTPKSGTQATTNGKGDTSTNAVIDDLVACLRQLTSASNAPLFNQAPSILSCLVSFLQTPRTPGASYVDAFATVNSILSKHSLDFIETIQNTLKALLPVISHAWLTKLQTLKDEMLITLVHSKAHLESMLQVTLDESADLRHYLEKVVEVMLADYTKKAEKDQLQIDDLQLRCSTDSVPGSHPLQTALFSLKPGVPRSENGWMTVYFLAHISALLDSTRKALDLSFLLDEDETPNKRQRGSDHLLEYIRQIGSTPHPTRICALQIIAFMVQGMRLSVDDLETVMERLANFISDGHAAVSSWAMLAIAACTLQIPKAAHRLKSSILTAWHLTSRTLTAAASCRAASHLMDMLLRLGLLEYAEVAEFIDAMISSADLHGPVILADTTSSLWVTVLHMKSSGSPHTSQSIADRMIRWVFSKWAPSNFEDRSHLMHNSQHTQASDITRLLLPYMGREQPTYEGRKFMSLGPIALAWLEATRDPRLVEYLLLLNHDGKTRPRLNVPETFELNNLKGSTSQFASSILDYCIREVKASRCQWAELTCEKTRGLPPEMFRVLTSLCIISWELANDHGLEPNSKVPEVHRATNELLKGISNVICRGESEQQNIDAILEVLSLSLPRIQTMRSFDQTFFDRFSIGHVVYTLSRGIQKRRKYQGMQSSRDNPQEVAFDDDFESQVSNGSVNQDDSDLMHRSLTGDFSVETLRMSTLNTMSLLSFAYDDMADRKEGSDVPAKFVEHLVSLSPPEFLASRHLVMDLVSSPLHLSIDDAETILDYAAQNFLEIYQYERSEISTALIVELMSGTVSYWSDTKCSIYNLGADIYEWLIRNLDAGVTSIGSQTALARLFYTLMETQMDYAQMLELPSVRTSLFGLLKACSVQVRYFVVEQLPDIFSLFVLGQHDAVFADVHESLPIESDWLEAIALRLLALCRLGSSWHTLLRLSVYHIFETAGLLDQAARHAQWCMETISRSLKLDDPRALFRLFAPQLLYTWLDAQPLEDIRFSVFGNDSLAGLLQDVDEEAYSQMLMRSKSQEIENLLKYLNTSHENIARKSFARAAAYCIAWDTCNNAGSTQNRHSSESQLKQLFGQDEYSKLIQQQFPMVVAVSLLSMDHLETLDKGLLKHPNFSAAGQAMKDMQDIASSTMLLPACQQPSFPARFIFDQLERMGRRTGFKAASFWSPDCFVCVARYLLDAIDPALGSLHAAMVIRKYRILISLAGPVAFEGYPLQMSLNALRPFLTDQQCASDAIGIMQYLLQHGRPALLGDISFVAGLSISTLISFRQFLSLSHDSTTQESQHIETMHKAQDFHSWLKVYLGKYAQELLDSNTSRTTEASLKLFNTMVHAAVEIRTAGNFAEGAPEGKLLLALLEDEGSSRRLLNEPSRELAYNLLSRNFDSPPSFRDDVLGSARKASVHAASVWKSMHHTDNSTEYFLWAARVMGRMYAATGQMPESLRQAVRSAQGAAPRGQMRRSKTSRILITEVLIDLLFGGQPKVASLAEGALRSILSVKGHVEELSEVGKVVPHPISVGLSLSEYFDLPLQQPIANDGILRTVYPPNGKEVLSWVSDICIALVTSTPQELVVGVLPRLLSRVKSLGKEMFPYILHLALYQNFDNSQVVKSPISEAYRNWLERYEESYSVPYLKIILGSLLYLRKQPIPREHTIADRSEWLDMDYLQVSRAAVKCGMHRAALLFMETYSNQPIRTSRRSSVLQPQSLPTDLQLSIYQNLDEPDSFYGVERDSSITSVLERFEYEENGFKSLMFRSARQDSQIRRKNIPSPSESGGVFRALTMVNLNSITHSLLSNADFRNTGHHVIDGALGAARRLEQWDIRAPPTTTTGNVSESAVTYAVLQGISSATNIQEVRQHLDRGFLKIIKDSSSSFTSARKAQSSLRALAVLTEIDEVMSCRNTGEFEDTLEMMRTRGNWMEDVHLPDVRSILSSRETLLSLLCGKPQLQELLHTGPKDLRAEQVKSLIDVSVACRRHGVSEEALASVTYLSDLIPECRQVNLDVESPVQFEVASVLWDQGEMTTSIRMLQQLENSSRAEKKTRGSFTVPRSILLVKLGKQIDEARLEKPDEIMKNYLEPAIEELKSNDTGPQAGKVFHEFAAFCDRQLQSQETIDDMGRIKMLADRKEAEAREYERMAKAAKSKKEKVSHDSLAKRSRRWYDMDMMEYQRLADSREAFLRQSLENYMLSLRSCDDYNNDVLRMFALWFEYANLPLANEAVARQIETVPSGKFTVLMNQLSSRLQDEDSHFQQLLSKLIYRICIDHPYHGMNHMFSGSIGIGVKDDAAKSRTAATKELTRQLRAHERGARYWKAVYSANMCYHDMAILRDDSFKIGRDLALDKFPVSRKLMTTVPSFKVPPITMNIPVNPQCSYTDVPRITSFKPTMGIAGGISMPKIVTAIASNGRPYKQLFKSGNDDLRQDAIMEQVFEHVSQLLQNHAATRLRNLQIRTYKVLPLSARSGVMEFVQNTKALMDYLIMAHEAYYPKDWKTGKCRMDIQNISQHSADERLKVYRNVAEHFHPVLRYFFLERFEDPDEWFEKRLAYTRSTAAISILGHVLGLGDRHCHNILLDEKSGEVVHIDLGVAFEAGRVLPVPEVVPFRLTRDIVDAMGYTKTEGVFRRCCEFTMDTLRDERDSIMTILNVLRYDPLYSWSLSPLKAKKMQEEQAGEKGVDVGDMEDQASKRKEDDTGEAGRALSVVERKLSKALSSAAAVSELIQQATDERNLAVLYSGKCSVAIVACLINC